LALFAGGRSDASLSSNTAVNVAGDAEYVGDTKELRWHASVIGKDRNPHVLHGLPENASSDHFHLIIVNIDIHPRR
ncbi:hypothetical protein, partial [Burkholderia cenocepacia]